MSNWLPTQQAVFQAARKLLKREPWYQGVCLDNFPTEEECHADFDRSVERVFEETRYWDGYPKRGGGFRVTPVTAAVTAKEVQEAVAKGVKL